jgi:hypothetical protein
VKPRQDLPHKQLDRLRLLAIMGWTFVVILLVAGGFGMTGVSRSAYDATLFLIAAAGVVILSRPPWARIVAPMGAAAIYVCPRAHFSVAEMSVIAVEAYGNRNTTLPFRKVIGPRHEPPPPTPSSCLVAPPPTS